MYKTPFFKPSEHAKELRDESGHWLRSLRKTAGLTQTELCDRVGFGHYSAVGQIETGRRRIPPAKYEAYAAAMGMNSAEFMKTLLRHYDPYAYEMLYSSGRHE